MSTLLGLGLLLLIIPLNYFILKKAKTMSVNMAYMLNSLSMIATMFIILIYMGVVLLTLSPQLFPFTIGLLFSIILNMIFKIVYTLK